MRYFEIVLEHLQALLVLGGFLACLLAIVAKVRTKWITIDLPHRGQRIASAFLGAAAFALGLWTVVRVPLPPDKAASIDGLLAGDGKLEWQWAGQNWIGYVQFYKDPTGVSASTEIQKIFLFKGPQVEGAQVGFGYGPDVLTTITPGRVTLEDGSVRIQNLLAQQGSFPLLPTSQGEIMEGVRPQGGTRKVRLEARLQPVLALAGRLTYTDLSGGRMSTGDMVLVKYNSTVSFQRKRDSTGQF